MQKNEWKMEKYLDTKQIIEWWTLNNLKHTQQQNKMKSEEWKNRSILLLYCCFGAITILYLFLCFVSMFGSLFLAILSCFYCRRLKQSVVKLNSVYCETAGILKHIQMNHESWIKIDEEKKKKYHEPWPMNRFFSNEFAQILLIVTYDHYEVYFIFFSTLLMQPNHNGKRVLHVDGRWMWKVSQNRISVRCSIAMKRKKRNEEKKSQNNWFTNGWQIGCGKFTNVSNKSNKHWNSDICTFNVCFESKMIHLAVYR